MKQGELVVEEVLRSVDLEGRQDQTGKLIEFGRLLCTYREANVIGTRNEDEVMSEHIGDSLSCLQFDALKGAGRVADVGSGAGLPGIPLAIVLPDARFTLVDSSGKKVVFQKRAVEEIGVPNVESRRVRLEEFGRESGSREGFDAVVSRALAPLDVLAEYCLPLVRVGGVMISMKGKIRDEEILRGGVASRKLGGGEAVVHSVNRVAGQEEKERHLVIIEKLSSTSQMYPRAVGVPKKYPLGYK